MNMTNTKTAIAPFTPMLAHKKAKEIDFTKGVYVQPKLDGVRCYARLIDGQVRLFSRNQKEFLNAKHIATELRPIFDKYPHIVLDGELYNHKFRDNFNKIISLVRKQKPTQADRFESSSLLQYHVYDMYDSSRPDMWFCNRDLYLGWYLGMTQGRSIKSVKSEIADNEEEVQSIHTHNKKLGYEGSMLRVTDASYEQKRSWTLQKVKDWHDTEITVTGYVEGKGKFAGGLGKFIGLDEEGLTVEVPWPTLTIGDRRRMWQSRDEQIGKILTFEYFERTPGGAYRFPRAKAFRNYE